MTESGWLIAGRYRVLRRIGAGGMADVLRAHDGMLDRDVAVKVFRTAPVSPGGVPDTASGVERQRAELAALARLNHPNLTTLYDGSIVGQQGPAYLVMELIDGPSLAQAIEDGGLSESMARLVGAQIGDALAYVHAAGMVHRDVKPANILLGSDRNDPSGPGSGDAVRARLTDFGIVRLVGSESLTQADMTLGSASYLAPEQARGSAVGPPADIYALGLTMIEALTGRRSFDGPALEAVVARLTNDPEIPAGLPEPWPALLRAMTARDPARRPTASRVAATLRGAESLTAPITSVPAAIHDTAILPAARVAAAVPPAYPSARPSGSPRPPARPAPEPRRWSASLLIAGILVLALIIAGVALLLVNAGGGSGSGSPTTPSRSTRRQSSSSTRPSSSTTGRSTAPSTSDSTDTSPTEAPSTEPSAPSTTPSTPASTPTTSAPSTRASRTSASTTPTATRTKTSAAAAGDVDLTPSARPSASASTSTSVSRRTPATVASSRRLSRRA